MASSKGRSVSEQWRENGNESYRAGTVEGLAPVLRSGKLQEAVNRYARALATAVSDDERSSANKNAALANWKMAKGQQASSASKKLTSFTYKEALKHFKEAKRQGTCRGYSWNDNLETQASACWQDIHEWVDAWDFQDRVQELEQLVPLALDGPEKAREYYGLAQTYFQHSLSFLVDRAYVDSLRFLHESYFPLNEARRLGHRDSECDLLDNEIYQQRCVAESFQARTTGEELLTYVLSGEEILNIDMVWEVVDWFCRASQLTRDRDLEMEAIALSALGKVYDQVLKLKDRAKVYLTKTLELANTMVPRNVTGEDWYEFARSTLERYQQEKVSAEEGEWAKKRERVMAEIKDQLVTLALKQGLLTKVDFLKFLYTTHPPKRSDHTLGEVPSSPDETQIKKLYQRAVIHYHPDKVSEEEHGLQWKVLTEEITKMLVKTYELYKLPS